MTVETLNNAEVTDITALELGVGEVDPIRENLPAFLDDEVVYQ